MSILPLQNIDSVNSNATEEDMPGLAPSPEQPVSTQINTKPQEFLGSRIVSQKCECSKTLIIGLLALVVFAALVAGCSQIHAMQSVVGSSELNGWQIMAIGLGSMTLLATLGMCVKKQCPKKSSPQSKETEKPFPEQTSRFTQQFTNRNASMALCFTQKKLNLSPEMLARLRTSTL